MKLTRREKTIVRAIEKGAVIRPPYMALGMWTVGSLQVRHGTINALREKGAIVRCNCNYYQVVESPQQ